MKVNERKGVLDPRLGVAQPVGPDTQSAAAGGVEPGDDQVTVSETARELARLRTEVGDVEATREDRVSTLRALVARGDYSADPRVVARKLLRELTGELVA
jgi:flagellar biosynthesis anti-sigma factor FlgM